MAKMARVPKTIESDNLLAALESFERDASSMERYQPYVFKQLAKLKCSLRRDNSRLTRKDWQRQKELMNA